MFILENFCEKGIDLGIIVDWLKSVRKFNFIMVKNNLKMFLDNFNISENGIYVFMIFFVNMFSFLFNFSDV